MNRVGLTGDVCAVAGQSVAARWWSAHSAAAPQACWCHWGSALAVPSHCAWSSSHTDPQQAPSPPPHIAHPANHRHTHTERWHFKWTSSTCVNSVRAPGSRLISKGDGRQWCYLPLCKVEHSDEAKHFIRVVVITVFWHLSLLKHSEGMSEYMLRAETAKNKKSPVRTEMSLNH